MSDVPQIHIPETREDLGQMLSLQTLYQQLREHFEEMLVPCNPVDVLAMEGEGRARKVLYELRTRTMDIPEPSLVGKITTGWFRHVLILRHNEIVRQLNMENEIPWSLVAVKIERIETTTKRVTGTEQVVESFNGGNAEQMKLAAQAGKLGGIEYRKRTIMEDVPVYTVRTHLTFCDLTASPISDPNAAVAEVDRLREMTAYAESRLLRDMPRGLRLDRDRSEALLREFYARMAPAPATIDRSAVDAFPPSPPAPVIDRQVKIPEVPAVAGVEDTVRALRDQGMAPASIAKRTGLPQSKVTEILGAS